MNRLMQIDFVRLSSDDVRKIRSRERRERIFFWIAEGCCAVIALGVSAALVML
jgi:hypothetical protein